MKITKNDTTQITPHYKVNDLFTHSLGVSEHYLDPHVFDALEALFIHYGKFKINSSYRSKAHQFALTGKTTSAHCLGIAVDISFPEDNVRNCDDFAYFLLDGLFTNLLQSCGVGGVGLYDTFIHLDFRTPETYNYGKKENGKLWAVWNKRTRTVNQNIALVKKKFNLDRYTKLDEDGQGLAFWKIALAAASLFFTFFGKKIFR